MSKPSKDHEYRKLVTPKAKWNSGKGISSESKVKNKTRREIENRLENYRLERELSIEHLL